MIAAEFNYETHDKEMLAIIACFKEWRHYLEGAEQPTTVYTNHRSLEYFTTSKQLNRRQARWSEFLADFNFVIKYCPGVQGTKPNALTQRSDYHPQTSGSSLDGTFNPNNFRPLIRDGQYLGIATTMEITSNIPAMLLDGMRENEEAPKLVEQAHSADNNSPLNLDTNNNLRYNNRLCVPDNNNLRTLITKTAHDHRLAGHPGQQKTMQLVQRNYWWPSMKKFIHHYVDTCNNCNRTKSRRHLPFGDLKSLPIPPYPWSSISMDLIECLPTSEGFNTILVVVD